MSAQYDQIIYDTAIKEGFNPTAAKLIVAQARFESADYTSNVFQAERHSVLFKILFYGYVFFAVAYGFW
jgi:hypothetical protein